MKSIDTRRLNVLLLYLEDREFLLVSALFKFFTMTKSPLFLFAALVFFSCQQQGEDIPQPHSEQWELKLVIGNKGTDTTTLTSTSVRRLVGAYDPTTMTNPVVGKVLDFGSVKAIVKGGTIDIYGAKEGNYFVAVEPIRLDGGTGTGTGTGFLNFCDGPQGVPVTVSLYEKR